MSGETDLGILLERLSPRLREGEFVFCSFEGARYGAYAELEPIASIRESEGLSLVLSRAIADREGVAYVGVFRQISLGVHSSLQGVGLTAAVSRVLAQHDISVNLIAGTFHDHLFVPAERAAQALELLQQLSR